jgi:hypothetical protein
VIRWLTKEAEFRRGLQKVTDKEQYQHSANVNEENRVFWKAVREQMTKAAADGLSKQEEEWVPGAIKGCADWEAQYQTRRDVFLKKLRELDRRPDES